LSEWWSSGSTGGGGQGVGVGLNRIQGGDVEIDNVCHCGQVCRAKGGDVAAITRFEGGGGVYKRQLPGRTNSTRSSVI
jgi:hypothetical protein